MCRQLIARGDFDPREIFRLCGRMSQGNYADHEGPIKVHPNGWGAVWAQRGEARGCKTLRSLDALTEQSDPLGLAEADPVILGLHARHATLEKNLGYQFTHPISRTRGKTTWHLMHNGFLPTVFEKLGMDASNFDSEEYLHYVVNEDGGFPEDHELNERMETLSKGGSSGNAFFFTDARRVCIYNWYPEDSPFPTYFTLFHWQGPGQEIISSERIPEVAPIEDWVPLSRGQLIEWTW